MNVSKDFEELFACLNARGVKYLVVGAYAVAFHAKPRYTKDLDILVETTRENAQRLLEALADFGLGGLKLTAEDFVRPDQVIQVGVVPNRVDFITSISGVGFEEAWAGRVSGAFGDQRVSYIGKAELISNKRAAGRPQDQIDIDWLTGGP